MPKARSPNIARATAQHPAGGCVLQRKCACGGTPGPTGECEECRKKRLQRKTRNAGLGSRNDSAVPSIVGEVLNTPGKSLDASTRAFMEPRFGHDFGKVRVHTDAIASESASAVNAHAYTVGRDMVFGPGRYMPGTKTGDLLIAHELTHVVQQSRSSPSLQPQSINQPGDTLEQEAGAAAIRVMSGNPVIVSGTAPVPALQRDEMQNHPVQDFQPDPTQAKACVVHMHGEEKSALAVAKEVRSRRCVNLVHLDTDERYVKLAVTVKGAIHTCEADPNRVFSDKGRSDDALRDQGCHLATDPRVRTDVPIPVKLSASSAKPEEIRAAEEAAKKAAQEVKAAAALELKTFAENEWGAAIGKCRGGTGSPMLAGPQPVLALHNNGGGDFTPRKFRSVAEPNVPKGTLPGGVENPSMKPGQDPHDFFLVTKANDFDELRKNRNVILQANPVPTAGQDGSLSVALASDRFINVEKTGRGGATPDEVTEQTVATGRKTEKWKVHTQSYIDQYGMATQALDLFNVPEGPCPKTGPAPSNVPPAGKAAAPGADSPAKPAASSQLKEDAPVLEREAADPKKPPAGCRLVFSSQSDLDNQKALWTGKIARMPIVETFNWILGGPDKVSSEAREEVVAQRACMIAAMRGSLKSLKMALPAGDIVKSDIRPYGAQKEEIWQNKFNFTFGTKFGRISDSARLKCGKLIGAEEEWDPKSKDHKDCWGRLDSGEKAKEILMTSAAPGISRHHAGTDFDIGQTDKDLEPGAWTGKGQFADAYRWLAKNASTYGFIQPFDTKGGYGQGYLTERWHWSYYPIAQALLEFSRNRQTEIQQVLKEHWSDSTTGAIKPEFKFIWDNWKKFMFNVEEKGRF
jgi:uncharacterized protein DUF4157/D-alanyl-D-alanine carboxypeptidase-like protein